MHQLRTKHVAARATAIVVGVALIATGCGSTPSTAQFNAQANSICQTYSAKLKSVGSQLALSQGKSERHLESSLSSALSLVQQGTAQLKSLSRPNGEGVSLNKVFKAQDAQVADLQSLLTAIKQRNATRTQSAETALEESEAPLNQQFNVLGLSVCGSG
jgi:hypothetical protein